MRPRRSVLLSAPLSIGIVSLPARAIDVHFDYTSFDNPSSPGSTPHFGQAQFNVLNYPSINGNYMMTSTDGKRSQMVPNNNELAEFYNWLQQRYDAHTTKDGVVSAGEIDAYVKSNSPTLQAPKWLILNEMSTSLWPNNATYRQWMIDTTTSLHDTYGYNVVTYTTFAGAPQTQLAADWQALAAKSYIAVENYLSGQEIMNHGSDYASRKTWAQAQYDWSQTVYGNIGVSSSRLFMSEHFGNTAATYTDGSGTHTTGWGRAGISAADWDTVLQIRQDAILAANYAGFLAYGWGENGMLVSEAEQIQHEYWYRTRLVLPTQQPQWLVDNTYSVNGTSIPLSWSQQLNWLGGVPDANGAIANFFRTNTAARTITLDGSKTVGTLSFNSPSSYTINAGTGGTLTLNNNASAANLTVAQGTHTLAVPLAVAGNANFNITGTLNVNAGLSTTGAGTITRSGSGTLNISGAQSNAAARTFLASAGTTNFNSSADANLAVTLDNSAVNFNVSQTLGTVTLNTNGSATLAAGNRMLNTNNLVGGGGKLNLTDGAAIARAGLIGTLSGANYSGIQGLIQLGRNSGNWNGNGLYTSMTDAKGAAPRTTLATALASQALGIGSTQTTTWRGQTVNGDAVLIAYTWAGDANLSGTIDADDYFQISAGYNNPMTGRSYYFGDFNYDGVIDGSDYFIIDSNFPLASLPLAPELTGAGTVPEPGGFFLIVAGLACAGRRRRV
jgi:hypothetical protein